GSFLNSLQAPKLAQQVASVINSTLTRAGITDAQNNRPQLSVSQSLGTHCQEFFSGPIFRRPFFDAGWVSTHGPSPNGFEALRRNSKPALAVPSTITGGLVQYFKDKPF